MKVILLAAGCSQRMGQAKQLLKWNDKSMLQHCLDKLQRCNLDIILVIGAFSNEIKASLEKPYEILENPQWSSGMGSSIALGMSQLNNDDKAVMIMLADQPAITEVDIKKLISSWKPNPDRICCSYSEQIIEGNEPQKLLRVPAIFPWQYFSKLSNLEENTGAKAILKSESDNLIKVAMPNTLININTTDDWNHWLQQLATQQVIQEDTKDEIYAE